MLMYNRELVLPIDVKHKLDKGERNERKHGDGDGNEEQPFDLNFFDAIFSSARKSEQQLRMKQPKILKLLRKNKNEIVIIDICQKPKL